MKLRLIFALGLLVAVLVSCECLRNQSSGHGRVQIDEHFIRIPGTVISLEDRVALNKVFRKYDSALYRITAYEKGSVKKQIGKLDEMQIEDVAQEYSQHALASGLSNWTSQIGFRTHVTHFPPTTHVTRPGDTTHVTRPGDTTHVTTVGNPSHVTTGGNPSHVTTLGETTHVTTAGYTTDVTRPGKPSHVTIIDEESDALVHEVTPILEKYSK